LTTLTRRHAVRGGELALTTDELRLLARLGGLVLPPMVGGDEATDDSSVRMQDTGCEAAVGRCLLARGLARVETGPDGVEAMVLSGRARRLLAALTEPGMLAEAEIEAGDRLARHAVAVSGSTALALSEREPDVWRTTEVPAATQWLLGLVRPHLAGCAPPTGTELRLPAADHLRVDMLVMEGFDEEVEPALLATGAEPQAAAVWAAALVHRSGSGAVHVARRTPGGWLEAATVRWVAAGARGLWRLDLETAADGGDGGDGAAVTVVRGATAGELAAEVMAALAGDPVRTGGVEQESEAAPCPRP
jgi:hypothetical protein